MAIALSARAEGIACHAASKDMDQDTGIGMNGIMSRTGDIGNMMIAVTNPGDTHESITSPSHESNEARRISN
jgi:hypothetical protein